MKKRLFIAIVLPGDIRKGIAKIIKKYKDLDVRWLKSQNWHLTLVFIGYRSEEEIDNIFNIIGKELEKISSPFEINFKKVSLGPTARNPRLIWLEGKADENLKKLVLKLKKILRVKDEYGNSFLAHVTLARFKKKPKQQIDEDVNLTFSANNVVLMESQLKKTGAKYKILKSFKLGA